MIYCPYKVVITTFYVMLENHLYNLLLQLSEEHKSLWRIKDEYLKDAGDCADCQAIWKKLKADKEAHVVELTALVKKHLG
ncbi:MAG: hypothetical protein AAB495_02980 [Patescibacteria group bacterium]